MAEVVTLSFFLNEEARTAGLKFAPPRRLDAGFDLPALENCTLAPRTHTAIRTGLHLAIPEGYVGLVRDRSSVALRGGAVTAGVIDAAYRGEVKVVMHNLSDTPIEFKTGDRIAQCVVIPHLVCSEVCEAASAEELGTTTRGSGGFGSTGV